MIERLYFDHPDVYVLADYDEARQGGRVRHVVCEHPDGIGYASQLAAALGVPLHVGPDAGGEAAAGRLPPAPHPACAA